MIEDAAAGAPSEAVVAFSEAHLAAMAEEPPSVFDADETPLRALTPFDEVRPRAWSWMQPGGGS
ncbi:MAG: hypothetical protein FWD85_08300 [Microbacteriaceae bacterium]|nr:hypothetical protein [Microbacteriaceae bacterium]MCL2795292.1 hypothetical protein [Microbacteriaceae bacterium]